MAISDKRVSEFESWGPEKMALWLKTAAIGYFCYQRGRDAFSPFELFIETAESTASEMRLAYHRLSTSGQVDFRTALVNTLASVEAKPHLSEVWKFLIELSWQLPEPDVVPMLRNRFNDHFFDALCSGDSRLFHHVFGYILNIAPHRHDAAECIRGLVGSSRYHFCWSRLTLLRLCEIDPDNWPRHFSLLRDSVYELFKDVRNTRNLEAMIAVQDELARQIFEVIGFDRFLEGFPDLHSVKDAPLGVASDNWYWRSLFERQKLIQLCYLTNTNDLRVSLHTRPNQLRPLSSRSGVIHVPPSVAVSAPPTEPGNGSAEEKWTNMADGALGLNKVQFNYKAPPRRSGRTWQTAH